MNWKKILRWTFMVFAFLYFAIVLSYYFSPPHYKRCDLYTAEMNGGVRTFEGKSYNVVLCGLNGLIDPSNYPDDEVRLQVFSMDGELLAERFFQFYWNLKELEYGNEYLIYADGGGKGFETKMPMPPSRLDWIRARLPKMWP